MVDDIMPEESMTDVAWLVLGSTAGELVVSDGSPPFLVYEPRPCDLPSLVSIPLAPRAQGRKPILGRLSPVGGRIPWHVLEGIAFLVGRREAPLSRFLLVRDAPAKEAFCPEAPGRR